jgi:hypothetical protein
VLAHPEHVKARLYDAFDIQVLYRQHMRQATIWATITDTTPGTVAALLTDPRTDSDTFGNLRPDAIATSTIHHRFRRARPHAPGRTACVRLERETGRCGSRPRSFGMILMSGGGGNPLRDARHRRIIGVSYPRRTESGLEL